MKYVIIIPDGAADRPLDELDGKTPLQAADIPHMDSLAAGGRLGAVRNIPDNMPCGSDVATLSVVGYDPRTFYTGRAPLEAAAQDIAVEPDEWIFRCNLVTVIEGVMEDYCAGHISTNEAAALLGRLSESLQETDVKIYTGVGYRHLMTIPGELNVETIPPHDILGQPVREHLPTGQGAEAIVAIMAEAHDILGKCEINSVRHELGENPATDIWLWGQGKMPTLPTFESRFGLRGAAITAVDLIRGISKLIGWDVIEVEGATGYVDTNYAGKGAAAIAALDDYDLVFVHIEAPDEAGHGADVSAKVHAIEQIDREIVGPVLQRLKAAGDDWRLMVLPDHPTPCDLRTHTSDPVPFAIAGKGMEHAIVGTFCENDAEAADLHIDHGHDLMEYFLTVR
ncbi:MAG: cofactor-independent phosphoglycerate mutase [Phycisphaerae bacterium]|nr:cofactor-independent phosphoglycerate mutase [Phycisphaerae bacterium]